MPLFRRLVVAAALVAVVSIWTACIEPNHVCPADLVGAVVPGDTTISLGQRFTIHLEIAGCDGKLNNVSTQWATSDINVVRLDTLTGAVIGHAVGDATVYQSGGGYSSLFVGTVHVR